MLFTKLTSCYIGAFVIIMPFLLSCSGSRAENDDAVSQYATVHAEVSYFDFDQVDSLLPFFDSIAGEYGFFYHGDEQDEGGYEKVRRCITDVERYRRGEARYYPASVVRDVLAELSFSAAYCANHGYEDFNLVFCEWFLMCVAYYAQDITCLVNMQTPDHRAGVLNFGSPYNNAPWWSYVILRRRKGFEAQCLGDESKITSIFQLEDNVSQRYYLCSNNTSPHVFCQELYWVKDDDVVVHVAGTAMAPVNGLVDFETYYFDVRNLSWRYCQWGGKHGDERIAVSAVPALTLQLCGESSSFAY